MTRRIFRVACLASGMLWMSWCYAGKVVDGQISAGTYGEVINCAFPNTVKLDGVLNDLAWTAAPWQFYGAKDATVPAGDDKDASITFAVTADDKYLYIAAHIADDKIVSGENLGCDVWKDDSLEFYIDGANDKAATYDVNDAQITIGANVIDVPPDVNTLAGLLGGCVGITQGPKTETLATGKKTAEGWDVEIAIPLKNAGWNIKPKNGLKIGFNSQYNDDDDKGDRDHKLIWSAKEVKNGEGSWQNPSLFAELQFVEAVLAVNPRRRAIWTWASLKATY